MTTAFPNPKPNGPYPSEVAESIAAGLNDEERVENYRLLLPKYPASAINKAYLLTREFQVITEYKLPPFPVFKLMLEHLPIRGDERPGYRKWSLD